MRLFLSAIVLLHGTSSQRLQVEQHCRKETEKDFAARLQTMEEDKARDVRISVTSFPAVYVFFSQNLCAQHAEWCVKCAGLERSRDEALVIAAEKVLKSVSVFSLSIGICLFSFQLCLLLLLFPNYCCESRSLPHWCKHFKP